MVVSLRNDLYMPSSYSKEMQPHEMGAVIELIVLAMKKTPTLTN